jgi:hypothetical protein
MYIVLPSPSYGLPSPSGPLSCMFPPPNAFLATNWTFQELLLPSFPFPFPCLGQGPPVGLPTYDTILDHGCLWLHEFHWWAFITMTQHMEVDSFGEQNICFNVSFESCD